MSYRNILPVAGILIPWSDFKSEQTLLYLRQPGFLLSLWCTEDVVWVQWEDRDYWNFLKHGDSGQGTYFHSTGWSKCWDENDKNGDDLCPLSTYSKENAKQTAWLHLTSDNLKFLCSYLTHLGIIWPSSAHVTRWTYKNENRKLLFKGLKKCHILCQRVYFILFML